jgi:phosphatase NudJ
MSRDAIDTWFFSLVVVRRDDQFLLVHEQKHEQAWYLPAGRVEPGETLAEAAIRETLEESGVEIELEGLLRLEHRPLGTSARVRAFFLARPVAGSTPRTTPNEHSLGARFVTRDEARQLPLRGDEVMAILDYAAGAPALLPMSMVVVEGTP